MSGVPIRRCAGCGNNFEKPTLLRVVRLPESKGGGYVFDAAQKLEGRSIYFCPTINCFETLLRRKAPEKLMKMSLTEEIRDAVKKFLSRAESAS